MRLLVTGAAGFIGSNFVHYWLDRYPDDHVVAFDLLTYAGNRSNLADVEGRIVFVEGDICDRELVGDVLARENAGVVVNFAAESHNSLAVVDPTRFFRTNVLGTQTLLDASRAAGVSRFHHVSTCEVYGDLALDSDDVFTEDSPYRPRTPYNASKAGADHAVRAYFETFGLPVTITNCSNNYGAYQFPEKVIPLFTTNALDDEPLPLYASTAEQARVAPCPRPLRGDRPRPAGGSRGGDVQRRVGARGLDRGDRGPRPRADGEAVVAQDDRPGSPGPRPPVPPRRGQDPPRARLGAGARLARGARGDDRVVRVQPRLVGAAQGARAGRGDRLAIVVPEKRPLARTPQWGSSRAGGFCREHKSLTPPS